MSNTSGKGFTSELEKPLVWGEVRAVPHGSVPTAFWVLCTGIVIAATAGVFTGWQETGTMLLLLVLAIPIGFIAASIPRAIDMRWLPKLVVTGFVVKLIAAGARYWALQALYDGSGDATGYHNFGRLLAPVWRSFQIPPLGVGTEFVQAATGLLYVPYVPTKLGGFLIYAWLAFLGQVLVYVAVRRSAPSPSLKWLAALIFLFPNIVYWPSSIGKESLMIFFIGIAVYGAARMFDEYRLQWLAVTAIGTAGCAVIRSHIALLIAISLATVTLVAWWPGDRELRWRRLLLVVLIAIGMMGAVRYAVADFGIDLSRGIGEELLEEELDPIFSGVETQTDRGGSTVQGNAIRSPADIPDATLRVIFRPLPYDAHNPQALVSSLLEGTLLLGLFLWRAPAMIRNLPRRWRSPLVLFSLVYTAGFVFGHSAILNLGIMARQRSQLIPFIFILLVELGRPTRAEINTPAAAGWPEPFPSPPDSQEGGGIGDERREDAAPLVL